MKIQFKFSHLRWMGFALILMACSDNEDTPAINLSQTSLPNVAASGGTYTIAVTGVDNYTLSSSSTWCATTSTADNYTKTFNIVVAENTGRATRTGTVTVKSGTLASTVHITQAAPVASDDYQYKIPVVFHVLYADKANVQQYVRTGLLSTILTVVNRLYARSGVNAGVEFYMATEDPQGNKLSEPGVNRVLWSTPVMSCKEFMGSQNNSRNLSLIWDTSKYLNVMLYTFTKDEENIAGISMLPYLVYPDALDGTIQLPQNIAPASVPVPICVSINNTYINSYQEGYYSTSDVTITLAHEMGHYLGLRHTFSESENDNDACVDSDYCTDTPTYNRDDYQYFATTYLEKLSSNTITKDDYDILVQRTNCQTGGTFTSTNLMDYAFSHSNTFTAQQCARMRYILMHSPYLPGPKVSTWANSRMTIPYEFPVKLME